MCSLSPSEFKRLRVVEVLCLCLSLRPINGKGWKVFANTSSDV